MGNIVRDAVLRAGVLEIGSFEFASGKKANNKLSMDKLFDSPEELRVVVHHLGRVVAAYSPQAMIGVPSGGIRLAETLNYDAAFPTTPIIYLSKRADSPGEKSYEFTSAEDQDLLEAVDSLVIVEDVFNRFTSTLGVLAVEGVLDKTQVVVGIWDRGGSIARPSLPVKQEALVDEYIPSFLRSGEELYLQAVKE